MFHRCDVWLNVAVGCDQWVAGSNPSRPADECNPGQVVNTCVPLVTKQYNLVLLLLIIITIMIIIVTIIMIIIIIHHMA